MVEALVSRYTARLRPDEVSSTVLRIRDEIEGHILAETLPSMLYELANQRLGADVVQALQAEFEGRLPPATIGAVLLRTRGEVAGQVIAESLPGLL